MVKLHYELPYPIFDYKHKQKVERPDEGSLSFGAHDICHLSHPIFTTVHFIKYILEFVTPAEPYN